ncbi:MAG: ExbD/TolR family protein [Spirochaetota bacterium]
MHFRRRLSPNANIDLIPMIDVVFQLVVFFMVSSTFVLTPGIALDLPESSSSEPVVVDRVVVTVASANELYLNRDRVAFADLDEMLTAIDARSEELEGGADGARSAIIEADSDVSYETIVAVLDIMRRNGYRGIALRTLEESVGRP